MNKTNVLYFLLIILLNNVLLAQTDRTNTKFEETNSTAFFPKIINKPFTSSENSKFTNPEDFRVLNSNNSYVEFEFIPKYTSSAEFLNAVHDCISIGKPDIGSRNFTVITPGDVNNRIEILEVRYEDLLDVEVKPIPTPQKGNGNIEVRYDYIYDNTVYSSNSLYPKLNADFFQDGKFRNKYFGVARINPVQFNPL